MNTDIVRVNVATARKATQCSGKRGGDGFCPSTSVSLWLAPAISQQHWRLGNVEKASPSPYRIHLQRTKSISEGHRLMVSTLWSTLVKLSLIYHDVFFTKTVTFGLNLDEWVEIHQAVQERHSTGVEKHMQSQVQNTMQSSCPLFCASGVLCGK